MQRCHSWAFRSICPIPLVETPSKRKVKNILALGISVPGFTDWQTGVELSIAHPLPSAPHFEIVLWYRVVKNRVDVGETDAVRDIKYWQLAYLPSGANVQNRSWEGQLGPE